MEKWTFVHNHVDGLAKTALAAITKLEEDNPDIEIEQFCFQEFKAIWKRENFFSSSLKQPTKESPKPKTELDWLLPEFQHIPLLGRNSEMNRVYGLAYI